jgi:hypothetical protein
MGKFPVHQTYTQVIPCSLAGNSQSLTLGRPRAEPEVSTAEEAPPWLVVSMEGRLGLQGVKGQQPGNPPNILLPISGAGVRGNFCSHNSVIQKLEL